MPGKRNILQSEEEHPDTPHQVTSHAHQRKRVVCVSSVHICFTERALLSSKKKVELYKSPPLAVSFHMLETSSHARRKKGGAEVNHSASTPSTFHSPLNSTPQQHPTFLSTPRKSRVQIHYRSQPRLAIFFILSQTSKSCSNARSLARSLIQRPLHSRMSTGPHHPKSPPYPSSSGPLAPILRV